MCGGAIITGIGIAGQIMGGFGEKAQYDAQAAAYKANARVSEQNAQLARAQAEQAGEMGKWEEQQFRKDVDQQRGAQKAAVGASGIEMTGSAAAVMDDTRSIEEEDAAMIRYNTQLRKTAFINEGQSFMQEASNHRHAAKSAKKAGKAALTRSLIDAAVTGALSFGGGSGAAKVPKPDSTLSLGSTVSKMSDTMKGAVGKMKGWGTR